MNNERPPTLEAPDPAAKSGLGNRLWDSPVTHILTYLVLVAALSMVIGLPLQLALSAAHVHFGERSEIGELIGEAVLATAALSAFLFMVHRVDKRSGASAGLERRGSARETSRGLLIGGVLFSLVLGALAVLGAYHVSGINAHSRLLVPFLLFLLVAASEETIFRGYIFQTLETRWGSGIALCVSALLFGLAHLANQISGLTPGQRIVGPVFIVFEASILMTAAYLLTRRLWLPIGIHWGWNFFESAVYGTTDSGLTASPLYTLLRSHISGPFLLTGGLFGPEASVICLIVSTAVGLLLLRQAIQRGQWRPRRPAPHSQISSRRSTLEVIQ